jgi:hypothetical protein
MNDGNQKMEIRSGRDRCSLACLPKDDYPVLPEFNLEKAISLNHGLGPGNDSKNYFFRVHGRNPLCLNGVNF